MTNDNRKKQQPNGRIRPYTVMLDGPVVVDAQSVEGAVRIAKRRQQPSVAVTKKEEEGDGS